MSKFFRSPNSSESENESESSTSSDGSSSEHETEVRGKELAAIEFAGPIEHSSNNNKSDRSDNSQGSHASLETITLDRRGSGPSLHRDFLLHALLEERCLNEVLHEHGGNGLRRTSQDERDIQREAQARYQKLCAKLAPLNLVSTGLDHARHKPARQKYRDGLNILRKGSITTTTTKNKGMPAPIRKLLTDSDMSTKHHPDASELQESSTPWLDVFAPSHQLFVPSQYLRDFEELGVLGKGGYGKVFHVKHRLDGLAYAVKKVPIRPSVIARIQAPDGQSTLDDMLTELRTLAKLDHPNVVRYFNSWIEWSHDMNSGFASDSTSSATDLSARSVGARFNHSESLRRVFTETGCQEGLGIEFESLSMPQTWQSASHIVDRSNPYLESDVTRTSATDGPIWSPESPALALHMQMAMYPMTLQDFIMPKPAVGSVPPLSHCFHPEPSVAILMAIIEGVEYLHSEGIIHRDLKPANIFLSIESNPRSNSTCVELSRCSICRAEKRSDLANLNVRIGDFGLVTQIAQSDSEAPIRPAVGTDIYRPAGEKSKISPKLDIFSVGIIAFELMWKFDTQMERRDTLQNLKNGFYPPNFSRYAGEREVQLKSCIDAMLSPDPIATTLSFDDLRARLASLLHNK